MAMLGPAQLSSIGLGSYGNNVQISDKASIYGASRIHIGSNVRIDDFCVLAAGEGGIRIGNYVHIAVACSLIGASPITLEDFSGLSSRVAIYSSSDDYSGNSLTNPTVPNEFKSLNNAPVRLGRHVIVGSGSIVLPGVNIDNGCAIGALSLLTRDCTEFGIYAGNPARRIKDRSRKLLDLERKLLSEPDMS